MKIFYYFQDLETNMFNWQRVHFVDELKRHGVDIDTFNPLYFFTPEQANETALRILKNGKYDLFFTNVCYHKMLFIDTIKQIKKMGIPTLCLRCDNLIIPFNDKVLAPHFDLVWLTAVETQHLYDKWGAKSFFAPYAANPYTFNYEKTNILRRVCFIGTPYGSRSIMINNLASNNIDVDAYCKPISNDINEEFNKSRIVSSILSPSKLETYISQLKFKEGRKALYGSLINKIKGSTKLLENERLHKLYHVQPSEMSALYSSYILCLSSTSTYHTDALLSPLKIINLRAFEVPMSGGINICRYNSELSEYFEEDKEILFYRDNDELLDKTRYYIEKVSDNEIMKMKRAARYRAEKDHTWWSRFLIAFEILGLTDKI